MKKVLGIILKVYAVFSMVVVTILIIAALLIVINFGKITAFAIEKAVDSYNVELNDIVSTYFESAKINDSINFESIKTAPGGGLQASFRLDNSILPDIDLSGFKDKSNEEIITELGITADDIPNEIKTLLKTTKQKLVLDFKDKMGNPLINREISAEEIQALLKSTTSP